MELIKNIFFNTDKLVENTNVKISYTGKLFQNGSKSVYIHYGFGNEWEHLQELEMEKTELGFQIEIDLIGSDTLNFCFKNELNEWDNNNAENYVFQIEPVCEVEPAQEELSLIISAPRKLRKSYIWSKKIKLAIYKLIILVPKIISGNYKRKIRE